MWCLTAVWLPALCLTANARETVQRLDTNGDGQINQWEYYEAGAFDAPGEGSRR